MVLRNKLSPEPNTVQRILRSLAGLLIFLTVSVTWAGTDQNLLEILTFEGDHANGKLSDWGGGPPGTIFADNKVIHSGHYSVRIERTPQSPEEFSTITRSTIVDFSGHKIQLRGWIKTQSVSGMVGFWLREDGDSGLVEFDNMASQQLKGTHDWAQYQVTIPYNSQAKALFYGFLVDGTGTAWADDLELLVDGKPLSKAPKVSRPKTVLDTDHEFDSGSGISVSHLSKVQISNLAMLGKVWGFLKYHHPDIAKGKRHWDYEFFRIMPAVLAAKDRSTADAALQKWIAGLSELPPCKPCATLDTTALYMHPSVAWIEDESTLGKELSTTLKEIYKRRPADGKQFYVSLAEGVGNPKFLHEPAYQQVRLPDAGYQLLALNRFWNIIEYWYPNRDVIGEDWDKVLSEFIPTIAEAKTSEQYQLVLMRLIARINDTHANLWSSLQVRPPTGDCFLPVNIRFIEGKPVVTANLSQPTDLKVGDIITELDGKQVSKLIESWKPYYAASNEATKLRDMARFLGRGACGDLSIKVQRDSSVVDIRTQRVKLDSGMQANLGWTHDLPGEAFQILPGNVAYLKMSAVKQADAPSYVKKAAATAGWIIDIRNYPSDFMVFALGELLIPKATPFVRFTIGDLSNPGAFYWGEPLSLEPQQPHYSGKLAILVDETTLSNAEYTAMAFRVAPGAVVIGSRTAGADGNVSPIPLPGGFQGMISGIGVFYPDKSPTQRIGIIPNLVVQPTLASIRAGKDEVLEAAIRWVLSPVHSQNP